MSTINCFANAMALFLAWVFVATGLPFIKSSGQLSISRTLTISTDIDNTQSMSPFGNGKLSSFPLPPMGIICGGNFNCEGHYCPPNATTIKNIVDQLGK
jgi:hypothetical protein